MKIEVSGRRFLISGKVQGVYYRGSTEEQARRLGISGWVRNLPDGNVEACAWGSVAALDEFERWLHEGPRFAVVRDVVVTEMAEHECANDEFEVR